MVTPFTTDNEIDYNGLASMIDWYIANGVHGLFAVCQSSEMFALSLEERVELARFVKAHAAGRVPVIASGHISDSMEEQIEEIQRISSTGVDAFVLVSNRLAAEHEDDEVWRRNAEVLLSRVPDVAFGVYECPYPYKRLLSPELLKWCADTGRFYFLKDTCCNVDQLRVKIEAVRGTRLKVFNANATTLLESLQLGAAGFSGVMANFHPDLYAKLFGIYEKDPGQANALQSFLGSASLIELQYYPVNAKYHLSLEGIPLTIHSRVKDAGLLKPNHRLEVQQLEEMAGMVRKWIV